MPFLLIPIKLIDFLDIFLVSILLYQSYRLIKGSTAINISIAILTIYLLWKLFIHLEMDLLSQIFGEFIGVGVIALLIVFQQEVRRFLLLLGNPKRINKGIFKYIFAKWNASKDFYKYIDTIVTTCSSLSDTYTGALIIIGKNIDLNEFAETGETLNSHISKQLIESIFYKNAPLHDGAILIKEEKIVAAKCILPISNNEKIPTYLGLRHRAAIGITEQTDALAIVVSEQTGYISYCKDGFLSYNISNEGLRDFLKQEFK